MFILRKYQQFDLLLMKTSTFMKVYFEYLKVLRNLILEWAWLKRQENIIAVVKL